MAIYLQPYIEAWGPLGAKRMWGSYFPQNSSEGPFGIGDIVINTAPTAGGTYAWVCTTAGNGGNSVWKAVALAA